MDLMKLVRENSYPGRGIVMGLAPGGEKAVIAYFIMGRSENSRNRIFSAFEGGVRTEAADESKIRDPSLILYSPVRVAGNTVIVTNGDQTDTIFEHLKNGGTFEDALRTRTFEPDTPNLTPRISGIALFDGAGGFEYRLSILKSSRGRPESLQRYFFEYPRPLPGEGHFIHTYKRDAVPLPSFEGEPVSVALWDDMSEFAAALWNNLSAENRISLFVRYTDIGTGVRNDVIINKYDKIGSTTAKASGGRI